MNALIIFELRKIKKKKGGGYLYGYPSHSTIYRPLVCVPFFSFSFFVFSFGHSAYFQRLSTLPPPPVTLWLPQHVTKRKKNENLLGVVS
jgi:hypothetical protein